MSENISVEDIMKTTENISHKMTDNPIVSKLNELFKKEGKSTDTKEFYKALAYTALLNFEEATAILDRKLNIIIDQQLNGMK
jgi:hypothetical protein